MSGILFHGYNRFTQDGRREGQVLQYNILMSGALFFLVFGSLSHSGLLDAPRAGNADYHLLKVVTPRPASV